MTDIPEKPLSRLETYLAAAAGEGTDIPIVPITRIEQFLAYMLGQAIEMPQAVTRIEKYVKAIAENGGGGGG